jgi:RNA polymerase sigma-70 factor (ECF subfamily)
MSDSYLRFYTDYKHKLFSYLIYKSGDPDIAQEIVQDSFSRHYQRYGHKAVSSPALLFTIARNALTDARRYQNRFRPLEAIPPPATPRLEDTLVLRETANRVRDAMSLLPEIERNMLALAVIGIPYKEIAVMFDVSVANVKVRIHRARNRLLTILEDED